MKRLIKSILTKGLQASVTNNYVICTKLLLRLGGDPNAFNKEGLSSVHLAALQNNHTLLKILLEKGGKANVITMKGEQPLHLIVKDPSALYLSERKKNIELLLEKGANLHAWDGEGYSPLHYAISIGNQAFIDIFLKQKHININHLSQYQETCLHLAVKRGSLEVVDKVLEGRDVQVNACNINGHTPLHLAMQRISPAVRVEEREEFKKISLALLKKEADPNLQDNHQQTPLHIATSLKNLEGIKALLQYKADPNIADDKGDTALHKAVSKKKLTGQKTMNGHLLMNPIDINHTLSDAIINALLNAKADKSKPNAAGRTPLDIAKRHHNKHFIALLSNDHQGKKPQNTSQEPHTTLPKAHIAKNVSDVQKKYSSKKSMLHLFDIRRSDSIERI